MKAIPFSNEFIEKLKSIENVSQNTVSTYNKHHKRFYADFEVIYNGKLIPKMEVTITKNSLEELEQAIINFLS